MKIVEFHIEGLVQGVGFRAFVTRTAVNAGLAGFVRNVRDGSVEGRVGGADADVDAFVDALYQGPPGARVDRLVAQAAHTRSLPRPFQVMPTTDTPMGA